jgi:glycerate kinase
MPGQEVDGCWVWFAARRAALVEMAAASGLTLVPPGGRDPLQATTRGTGELLRAAAAAGAELIWLAVGGSATVDGGMGAARALGWEFLDAEGAPLPEGGGALRRLARVIAPMGTSLPPIEVLCDVTNPLLGPHGAARVFGPQKGADPGGVGALEEGLARLAEVVRRDLRFAMANREGGGAAGGLAAGAAAFLGARLVSGVDVVMEAVDLAGKLSGADWVVTGEGCFDDQSLRGKVGSGVVRAAAAAGIPAAVVAGRIRLQPHQYRGLGIRVALQLAEDGEPDDMVMGEAAARMRRAGVRLAGLLRDAARRAPDA